MKKNTQSNHADPSRFGKGETPHPLAGVLNIIGVKWTFFIIQILSGGTKRFGEIKRELSHISSRTLSARLAILEKNGIIKKKIFPVIPPRSEYSLTGKGTDLLRIFGELDTWRKK